VEALRAHPSVAAVAEHVCGALWNISGLPAGKVASVSAGAVPVLAAAFKTHEGKVREFAHGALSNLGFSDSG
jgi:hypothetical protein